MEPTITITGGEVAENAALSERHVTFTVTLSEASAAPVTVEYRTFMGTAFEGVDFAGDSDVLTFAPGETEKTIEVSTTFEGVVEDDEHFVLTLFNPDGAKLDDDLPVLTATGVILDDDSPTTGPALFVSDPVLVEGDGGTTEAVFEVRLSRASGSTINLNYTTKDIDATAGVDYVAKGGTLSFAPGETVKTVAVTVMGDGTVEPSEAFALTVTPTAAITNGAADASGQATILDDDAVGGPVISLMGGTSVENAALNDRAVEFTVILSESSVAPITVQYRSFSDTAFEGVDFAGVEGTLTFAPGETVKTIEVPFTFEGFEESDENFVLTLFDPDGAVLEGGAKVLMADGLILDDDSLAPAPALFVSDPVLLEGDGGTVEAVFEVRLSRPSDSTIDLDYVTKDIDATAGEDYTAKSGTLSFAPGETLKTVKVQVKGDTKAEAAESFALTVTPTAAITNDGADASGLARILDDDTAPAPVISVSGDFSAENTALSDRAVKFTVTLSEASVAPVSVDYRSYSGTADEGVDFAGTEGTLTFAPGETLKIVEVPLTFEGFLESDENLVLALFNPEGGTLENDAPILKATGLILDDDSLAPSPALFVSSPTLIEGDGDARQAVFEVRLSRPTDTTVTLDYSTEDIDAVAGEDYTATSGTLSFAPGETVKTVAVEVATDTLLEGSERFALTVTPTVVIANDADNASGTATILDDDAAFAPILSLEGGASAENTALADRAVKFTVTLSEPSLAPVSVDYESASGTADSGVDFAATAGTLTFAPGEIVKIVEVPLTFEGTEEPDEFLELVLTNPDGAVLAGEAPELRAAGKILDDDSLVPSPAAYVVGTRLVEGDSGDDVHAVFEVHLSRPSDTTVLIDYDTSGDTANAGSDFVGASGTLAFAPGETLKTVRVEILGDETQESDESFDLTISPVSFVTNVDATGYTASATLVNDDFPGTTFVGTAAGNVFSGGEGDDDIRGRAGNDTLSGEGGDDLILGEDGNDDLDGGFGDDRLFGRDGDDEIQGGPGADRLLGERGDDEVNGGPGDDTLFGDNNEDTIHGGLDNDRIFGGTQDDLLFGDGGADNIKGQAGNDTIEGGDGDDVLFGDTGDDTLLGNAGDDNMFGGNDDDEMSGGVGDDKVKGNKGDDTIHGDSGDDAVFGRDDDDVVYGDAGNDRVFGEAGNDILSGGTGNDRLSGGDGNDILIFEENTGTDTVVGFVQGEDLLDFSAIASIDDIGDFGDITGNANKAILTHEDLGQVTVFGVAFDAIEAGDFIFT